MPIVYDPRYVNAKDLDKGMIPVNVPENGRIDMVVGTITQSDNSKALLRIGTLSATGSVHYDIYKGNQPYMADISLPLPKLPQNCKNCGAALRSRECEYCRTRY